MRVPAEAEGQPEPGADEGDEQEDEDGEGLPGQEHQWAAAGDRQPHQGQRGKASKGQKVFQILLLGQVISIMSHDDGFDFGFRKGFYSRI